MTVIRSKPFTFDENERDARFYAPRYADAHTVAMSACGSTTVEYVADGCDSTLWLPEGEIGSASALAFDPTPWVSITEARAALRLAKKAKRTVPTLEDYEAASTASTARRMANPRMASGTKVPTLLPGDEQTAKQATHRATALFLADHEVPTIASEWERSGWAQNAPGRRMGAHLAEKSARSSARISREVTKAKSKGTAYVPAVPAAERVKLHRRARTIANMISAGASIGVVVGASIEPAEALAMLKASSRWESLPGKTRAGLSSAVSRMRTAQSE